MAFTSWWSNAASSRESIGSGALASGAVSGSMSNSSSVATSSAHAAQMPSRTGLLQRRLGATRALLDGEPGSAVSGSTEPDDDCRDVSVLPKLCMALWTVALGPAPCPHPAQPPA